MIYRCTNQECFMESLVVDLEQEKDLSCPYCSTGLECCGVEVPELEDLTPEERRYLEIEELDAANFERMSYGELTPEEGGIRDHSFDTITYNEAGEPNGYC
jgi:hypothetical protein